MPVRMPARLPAAVALLAGLAALPVCAGPVGAAAPAADVILRDGVVYTADPARPLARSIAIADGRIVAVGDDAEVARHADAATRIVELRGRMVLPGLHDSHIHPMSAGLWLLRCRLHEAKTPGAVRRALGRCAPQSEDGGWLVARGWPDEMFARGARAPELDRIEAPHPVVLVSAFGDRHWLNARAFERAGLLDADGRDPVAGIERDARGRVTGFVHGAAAAQVRRRLPQPAEPAYRRALRQVSAMLNARGVTAVTDALVSDAMLEAYRAGERAGELTVRVRLVRALDAHAVDAGLARLGTAPAPDSAMLRADSVKLFVDGDIPGRGAALLEPYADEPGSRGRFNFEPADFRRVVTALDRAGYDVHFHAIGDGAVRAALDAIEHAATANGARDRRHQIAHLQLVDRADLGRFRALGAIANLQLGWARPDEVTALARLHLGAPRAARMLAFADLAAHGARIVAGSDGPLPDADPFLAIETGATRRAPDGSGEALQPAQALAVRAMLDAMTRDGAYAARSDAFSGTLVPGHAADLCIVDRDLLTVAPDRIGEAQVLLTLLDGRAVHVAPGFDWPR